MRRCLIITILLFGMPCALTEAGPRDPFDLPDEAKYALIEGLAQDILERRTSSPKGFEAELSLPELDVQGVVFSDNPQAIINNQVVGAGDEISGVEIVEIKKDEVIIKFSDNLYSLPVKQ